MSEQQTCQVRGCGAAVRDGFVCSSCAHQLLVDLRTIIDGNQGRAVEPARRRVQVGMRDGKPIEVDEICPGEIGRGSSSRYDAGWLAQLIASYMRSTRTGRGGVASEEPLLWHEMASDLRKELRATMVRYAVRVADARSITLPDDAGELTLAVWLERHVPWLRHQEFGAAAVTQVHHLVRQIVKIVDPVDGRQFIGVCSAKPLDGDGCNCACHVDRLELRRSRLDRPLCDRATCEHRGALCGTSLHADLRDIEVSCPTCRQRYNVAEYREWLLRKLVDVLATATEISTALTSLDQPVTPDRIRKWKQRGLLEVRGNRPRHGDLVDDEQDEESGDPVYRLGDVIALRDKAEAAAARRDARKAG